MKVKYNSFKEHLFEADCLFSYFESLNFIRLETDLVQTTIRFD